MLKLALLFVLASAVAGLDRNCHYTGSTIDEKLALKHFCPQCDGPGAAMQFSVNVSSNFIESWYIHDFFYHLQRNEYCYGNGCEVTTKNHVFVAELRTTIFDQQG